MTCLFLPPEGLTSKEITIRGEQARHLSVLRIKPGELIKIFDGLGHRYVAKVIKPSRKEVLAEIIKEEVYSAESPLSIILAQGIPKSDKMDFIIQKTTELGVKTISPIITEHSEVRETAKLERWRKIAVSASQQSGREKIPEIEEPVTFEDFLKRNVYYHPLLHPLLSPASLCEAGRAREGGKCTPSPLAGEGKGEGEFIGHTKNLQIGIIFSEEEKNQNLKKALKGFEGSTTITLLIGPEGGFSPAELTLAIERGFIPASLGPRILRTETAAITAISIIQYELGDLG